VGEKLPHMAQNARAVRNESWKIIAVLKINYIKYLKKNR
jgi:hypothetical protein